ncbi:MAG: DNA-binding protein Alba [Methanocellales archaeon]
MPEDNVIRVGDKPIMNYVLATVTQFNEGAKEVVVKARGRAISRAVDVVEVARNRFMQDLTVGDIKIGTEEVQSEKGEKVKVSFIEIPLKKP